MAGEGIKAADQFVRDRVGVGGDGGLQFEFALVRAAFHVIHGGEEAAGMVMRIIEVALLIDVDPGFRDHLAHGWIELEAAVHFVQPFADFRN